MGATTACGGLLPVALLALPSCTGLGARTAGMVHAELVFSVELTDLLDLDVAFTWDRREKPARDANGDRPEKNDLRLSVGVGVDF